MKVTDYWGFSVEIFSDYTQFPSFGTTFRDYSSC